ncbi:conserved hypothetical protein [Cellulomonas flavigena DSM 20109]|uniref:DUF3592 domain-containing protein n=1 Tax=Cellulomonas flavigena (strain ATCC 482 / DSM 20109 / BCRC 11376 / JCM 18109 / NBRC 3775 / NCIMB 8073 / NRS 134) TaxID=446466 RepID=D5UI97_CELFN|nr:DUF3592 domain-containing protein [Cellulomonas flavigena]ADG75442.1 conserved hypothetical protein [Cellulomonas flavigena DSM 20109]
MALLVLAVPSLVLGLVLVVSGVALVRRASRTPHERIAVEAVVVGRTFMVEPSRITVDHPVPGGWRRATLVEGLPTMSATGRVAQPGDRVVVWVDPRRPQDVRLSPAYDSGSLLGIWLVAIGVMAGLFGLVMVVA